MEVWRTKVYLRGKNGIDLSHISRENGADNFTSSAQLTSSSPIANGSGAIAEKKRLGVAPTPLGRRGLTFAGRGGLLFVLLFCRHLKNGGAPAVGTPIHTYFLHM